MTTYNLGQAVTLTIGVSDATGAPTDATVVLTLTKPDDTTSTPSVVHVGATGSGQYKSTFAVDQAQTWHWRWDVTGAITDNDRGQLEVGDPKPPTYASLAEVKSRLNIVDTTNDDEIADALDAASRDVESDTGRLQFWLDATATARTFNPHDRVIATPEGYKLMVDDLGATSTLSVETGTVGGTEWTAITDYDVGPDSAITRGRAVEWLIRPYQAWAYSPRQRIRVTAQWGWPRIPPQIKQATLIRAQRLYRRRDTPEGVAGFNDLGVVRLGRYDPDYDKLIARFMLPGFGG